MQVRQSRAATPSPDTPMTEWSSTSSVVSNTARAEQVGLDAAGPAPAHELAGPLAGLVLDVLPREEALEAAKAWIHNPAAAEWLARHAPELLDGDLAARALDTVWPRGTLLVLETELGGHLLGGLETGSESAIGRAPDGRASASMRTRAGISFVQALGLHTEDAFGRSLVSERADATASLTLDVCWDVDGLVLGGPRLAAMLLSSDPVGDVGSVLAPLALEAIPAVSLTGGVQARARVSSETLEASGLLSPVLALTSPLVDRAHVDVAALLGDATTITLLGPELLEVRARLEGTLSAALQATLAGLPALLVPEQAPLLLAALDAGATGTLAFQLGRPGTPMDARIELEHSSQDAGVTRTEQVVIRSAAELAATLRSGEAPVERTRTVWRALGTAEAAALLPLVLRGLGGGLDLAGELPGLQHLDTLGLEATARVTTTAIQEARDAGLRGLSADEEIDAILAAATGAPMPAGADRRSALAGARALDTPPTLRVVGRTSLGVGGAAYAGAGEDVGMMARGRTGLELDHPIPPAEAPAALERLSRAGQGERRA